jgi:hypothetical protein
MNTNAQHNSQKTLFFFIQILTGNINTYSEVERELQPIIIAQKVRIYPYSQYDRTVCLRAELIGCPFDGEYLLFDMRLMQCARDEKNHVYSLLFATYIFISFTYILLEHHAFFWCVMCTFFSFHCMIICKSHTQTCARTFWCVLHRLLLDNFLI